MIIWFSSLVLISWLTTEWHPSVHLNVWSSYLTLLLILCLTQSEMTLQKKKDVFSVVSERLSFFTPSPRPSPYSFIPRDDSETRSQPFSVPAETAVHIRERGGGGGGVGWGRDSERDRRKGRGCQRETLAQKALYHTDEISKNQHKYTSNTLLVLQKNVWSCSVTFLLWCSGFCRCRADEAAAAPQLPTPSVWTES